MFHSFSKRFIHFQGQNGAVGANLSCFSLCEPRTISCTYNEHWVWMKIAATEYAYNSLETRLGERQTSRWEPGIIKCRKWSEWEKPSASAELWPTQLQLLNANHHKHMAVSHFKIHVVWFEAAPPSLHTGLVCFWRIWASKSIKVRRVQQQH